MPRLQEGIPAHCHFLWFLRFFHLLLHSVLRPGCSGADRASNSYLFSAPSPVRSAPLWEWRFQSTTPGLRGSPPPGPQFPTSCQSLSEIPYTAGQNPPTTPQSPSLPLPVTARVLMLLRVTWHWKKGSAVKEHRFSFQKT